MLTRDAEIRSASSSGSTPSALAPLRLPRAGEHRLHPVARPVRRPHRRVERRGRPRVLLGARCESPARARNPAELPVRLDDVRGQGRALVQHPLKRRLGAAGIPVVERFERRGRR
ncbi:MAG: hypothetical protein V9G19_27795 [Tetrasphaera sp.]